jgi:outer membrane murein-binding lipoprotein Lpp
VFVGQHRIPQLRTTLSKTGTIVQKMSSTVREIKAKQSELENTVERRKDETSEVKQEIVAVADQVIF